ncbi:FAD-dependent oxidoreductase [bacterium]|nr:FAD-dependent oxidoreductase [bacterium]MCG2676574.1 FAD-dependent oxidoreductase [bacterium]
MKKSNEIIILGAGLGGLTCAYYLNKNYSIFEKESRAGGLCRSEKIDGFTFDYTGHLLHLKRNENKKLIKELLRKNLFLQKRKAWIYSKGIYTKYPFQANIYGLPEEVIEECINGLKEARKHSRLRTPNSKLRTNFKDWIYRNFGRGYAKHFMIPYNEKLWTVPLEEISTEWTRRFIPIPTLKEALAGARGRQEKDFGYNIRFYYPLTGGIGELSKSFLPFVRRINLNSEATRISLKDKKIRFNNGKEKKYQRLVSTIPLPELIKIIDRIPEKINKASKRLRYVSVFNLNLGIRREKISDKHWIYFPEKEFTFYRVGFNSNFSSYLAPRGTSSIYTEVSYSKDKPLDRKGITRRVIKDLIKAGIITSRDKILAKLVLDIRYAYPLYDHNHRESVATIQRFLRANDIYSMGRFGSWEYFSMEDVIEQGRETAQQLNGQ